MEDDRALGSPLIGDHQFLSILLLQQVGPPTCTIWPSTVAWTPTAGDELKSVAGGISRSRSRAAATIALASGCSESDSAAAARVSSRSLLRGARALVPAACVVPASSAARTSTAVTAGVP